MTLLAADINDASITVLNESAMLYREPGFALLEEDGLTTGRDAFRFARVKPRRIQDHYWSQLTTVPLPDRRFTHLSAADLASRQLEQIWKKAGSEGDRLVIAVPAYMQNENLGLLLGICNELGIPVAALVDGAVAATRREYRNAALVHVDLSLHSALLTRIGQAGQVQVEKTAVVEDSGLVALYETWISTIAEAFVQQSRFDPLHTAETEQMLLDRIPGWLSRAASGGKIPVELEYQGIGHSAEIDALELVSAAAPVYQRIVAQLRAMFRADDAPATQLTDRAAAMPGLADMLKARAGGDVYLLEAGAAARGLLTRCRDFEAGAGRVSLIRHLPWDQAAVEVEAAAAAGSGGQPTHLLHENTAFALGSTPLNVGSQAVAGERWIELERDMPGVSRQHCALALENGQCVVRDFSRYGTFLNGHKLEGSAVLQVGDLLRLGTPGYELRLIATEDAVGS
ncbi:MAG: FHA domain-containing protein [Woeseiaceae bacterium]|nr:FHA domain-containing protein [Woeseiaceae bacterium]